MPRVDNIADLAAEIAELKRMYRELATATPSASTSVGRGRFRMYDGSELLVEGSQKVTGTSEISGSQTVSGSQTIAGSQVTTGSQTIGSIVITPTGTYGGTIAASTLWIQGELGVSAGGIFNDLLWASGGLTMPGAPTTTDPANVHMNFVGDIQKVTSASRFKIDPQPMELPEDLLAVPVEAWIDRTNAETVAALWDAPRPFTRKQQAAFDGASLKRVPGVIAEKVAAAGGAEFVSYGQEGEIEGVAYDRLALARTAILARQLDAAMERIDELTKLVKALTEQ